MLLYKRFLVYWRLYLFDLYIFSISYGDIETSGPGGSVVPHGPSQWAFPWRLLFGSRHIEPMIALIVSYWLADELLLFQCFVSSLIMILIGCIVAHPYCSSWFVPLCTDALLLLGGLWLLSSLWSLTLPILLEEDSSWNTYSFGFYVASSFIISSGHLPVIWLIKGGSLTHWIHS